MVDRGCGGLESQKKALPTSEESLSSLLPFGMETFLLKWPLLLYLMQEVFASCVSCVSCLFFFGVSTSSSPPTWMHVSFDNQLFKHPPTNLTTITSLTTNGPLTINPGNT